MADFTPTQGRYLAFIHAYINLHGFPPAESEIAAAMCVSAPSAHQMIKTLEKKGLILRHPGQSRALQILIPEAEIPSWNQRASGKRSASPTAPPAHTTAVPIAPPGTLYVFTVFLAGGPVSEKYTGKEISRTIEIRGDQTLEQLHHTIFAAFDRFEEHLYEFQFGKRPFDPKGLNYGIPDPDESRKGYGDARTTTLDALGLTKDKVFGYLFDFGDSGFTRSRSSRSNKRSRRSPTRASSSGSVRRPRSTRRNRTHPLTLRAFRAHNSLLRANRLSGPSACLSQARYFFATGRGAGTSPGGFDGTTG